MAQRAGCLSCAGDTWIEFQAPDSPSRGIWGVNQQLGALLLSLLQINKLITTLKKEKKNRNKQEAHKAKDPNRAQEQFPVPVLYLTITSVYYSSH